MTKDHAHEILNQARAGRSVSKSQISRALTVTGDLPVYADTKTAFDAYSRDIEHEDDPLPIIRKHTPAGQWERSTAHYMRQATPFDGLTT